MLEPRLVTHPLAAMWLTRLRDRRTERPRFEEALSQLATLLCIEASRDALTTTPSEIETPLAPCAGQSLAETPVLVPVLRAGLGMLDGAAKLLPEAPVGMIGVRRDPATLAASVYLEKLPPLQGRQVLVLDPMLATAHSALAALQCLRDAGAGSLHLLCVLATAPGIAALEASALLSSLTTVAVDPLLNEKGYIVPGLGDAGDRLLGT